MQNNIFDFTHDEFLRESRTIFLFGEVNAQSAYDVCKKLKYLDYIDSEKEIILEINSGGGEVSSGFAIIDTINCIKSPVKGIVCGLAASMAALILACCTKGLRYALPHSTIMIHQPLGGLSMSQATDLEIYTKNIIKVKNTINQLLSDVTGNSIEKIAIDTERDYYLDAKEAIEYGLIDHIVASRKEEK